MHIWQICHPDKTTILKLVWIFWSLGATNEVWFDCLVYLRRSYAGELGPKHWTNGRYEYVMKLKQAALNFAKKRWADYILVRPSLSIYTPILDHAAYPNIYNRNIKKILIKILIKTRSIFSKVHGGSVLIGVKINNNVITCNIQSITESIHKIN